MSARRAPLGLAALALAQEHGCAVFPCAPRSKTPLVGRVAADGTPWRDGDDPHTLACLGGFHRATTHAEQIAEWWARWPGANIGVRLGAWLALGMAEGDSPEATAHLDAIAADGPPTWTYRAARGVNRLYRVPADIPERPVWTAWPDRFGATCEIKTGLGFFVAPPSVHPRGHRYAWVDGLAPDDVPLADLPQPIADEVRRLAPPAAAPPPGPGADRPRARGAHGAAPATAGPFDAARVGDALRYLDPDDYATWVLVGLALHASGAPQARGLWDAWSAMSAKYDPQVQARRWASMRARRAGGVTVASIFHHARRAGWTGRAAA
jgi:hypothetical protein